MKYEKPALTFEKANIAKVVVELASQFAEFAGLELEIARDLENLGNKL